MSGSGGEDLRAKAGESYAIPGGAPSGGVVLRGDSPRVIGGRTYEPGRIYESSDPGVRLFPQAFAVRPQAERQASAEPSGSTLSLDLDPPA